MKKNAIFLPILLLSGCSLFQPQIDTNDTTYNKIVSVEHLTISESIQVKDGEHFTFVVVDANKQEVYREDNLKYVTWRPEQTGDYTATVYFKGKLPKLSIIYNPAQKP